MPFLLGTDHSIRARTPITVHNELRALVSAGLTPYEALVTGTRNAAGYFGLGNEIGTIEVGKRADLVLVDGNPLEQVANAKQPAGTMVGGRWFSRAELERRLADSKAAVGTSP